MQNLFPKDVTDSMRTCILAIFWPRSEIISFFRNNGCTSRELKDVTSFKELNLSRAQIVDRVFEKLHARADGGLGQFRSLLQSLIEWNTFDPYYFDKLRKLDREEAQRQINHLSQLKEIRDARIQERDKKRRDREQETAQRREVLVSNYERFTKLYQGRDAQGKLISSQQRGYLLQSFLRDLCALEGLQVTEPFRIEGEEIDGTIKFEGENYIVEAKWQDSLAASNALYHFAHKVEGKMYGRGVFISINGYSDESVRALQRGKALRTILFDGGDLTKIAEELWTFKGMLDVKVKAAQTMGRIYVDADTQQEKRGWSVTN
jgi:hypothetical protein